ncbi:MAG: DinB family protein [Chloroflexota bacterium]|nr:DinB family protein [Chloroflexota bacterium]
MNGSSATNERERLLTLLAAERANLFALTTCVNEEALTDKPIFDDWDVQDVLAHIAAWDELFAERLTLIAQGREQEIVGITPEDMDQLNAATKAERGSWSMEKTFDACMAARVGLLDALELLADEDLVRPLQLPWGEATVAQWMEGQAGHDRSHADLIAAWRQNRDLPAATTGKAVYLAQLQAERADLLAQLVHLDEFTLCEELVTHQQTIKELLGHVAFWDRWVLETVRAIQAGQDPDLSLLQDVAAVNPKVAAASRAMSLNAVLADLTEARASLMAWLSVLPDDAFFATRMAGDQDISFPGLIRFQWQHDAEHAGHIAAWRETAQPPRQPGPKVVLVAALQAARQGLLTTASLLPVDLRTTYPVTDQWTLKDLLGHVADWEWWVVDAVSQIAAGEPPKVEAFTSIQAWNDTHAALRVDHTWERAYGDLKKGRMALDSVLETMSQDQLEQRFPASWTEREIPAYLWLSVVLLDHDLEHTHDLLASALKQ